MKQMKQLFDQEVQTHQAHVSDSPSRCICPLLACPQPQLPHLPTHPTAPFPQEMSQRIYPVLSNDMAKGAVTEYVTLPISSRTRQALADNGTLAQVRDVTERPHPSPRARNQQQQQQQAPPGPDGPQAAGGANGHHPEAEHDDQDAGNGFDFGNQ